MATRWTGTLTAAHFTPVGVLQIQTEGRTVELLVRTGATPQGRAIVSSVLARWSDEGRTVRVVPRTGGRYRVESARDSAVVVDLVAVFD